MKNRSKFSQRAEFLSPLRLIHSKKLSSKDVRAVKDNISSSMAVVRLITAILMFIVTLGMMILMGTGTGWNQIQVYGLASLIAQVSSMVGCLITIILCTASFVTKNDRSATIYNRVAAYILFVSLALQMLLGIYADAKMGFTTSQDTLSASIIFLAVLLVIQPAYWFDAIFLDLATLAALIGLSIFCYTEFGMKALHYYVLIAMAFPLCCYYLVTLIFYAEYQHYRDVIENDRLTNKAYYDDLTLCKNRHSLKSFIEENSKRWEEKDNANLLIIMFDIDNFKDYNDHFSHLSGDYCLKSIADAVRSTFPYPDLDFFRYGGEEFMLFFELDNPKDVNDILIRLRRCVKDLCIVAPPEAPLKIVSISVGATFIRSIDYFRIEEQIEKVDKYLYKAKENGKDISCLDDKLIK